LPPELFALSIPDPGAVSPGGYTGQAVGQGGEPVSLFSDSDPRATLRMARDAQAGHCWQ